MDNAWATSFLLYLAADVLMIYLPFREVSCWLGDALGKQLCTCSGAGNVGHSSDLSNSQKHQGQVRWILEQSKVHSTHG